MIAPGDSDHLGESLLYWFAAVGVAISTATLLVFACAKKNKNDTNHNNTYPDLANVEDEQILNHRQRTNTVSMEGNPLYGANKTQAEAFVKQQHQAVDRQANGLDEDELSNQHMHSGAAKIDRQRTGTEGKTLRMGNGLPSWLHTSTTKRESIDMLKADPNPVSGLFLVRAKQNNPGQYVLDLLVLDNDKFVTLYHYAISRGVSGEFKVDERPSKTAARSIESLIAELHGNTALIRCPLARGVPRKEADPELGFDGEHRKSQQRQGSVMKKPQDFTIEDDELAC